MSVTERSQVKFPREISGFKFNKHVTCSCTGSKSYFFLKRNGLSVGRVLLRSVKGEKNLNLKSFVKIKCDEVPFLLFRFSIGWQRVGKKS